MRRFRVNVRGSWYEVGVGEVKGAPAEIEVEVDGEPYVVEVSGANPGRDLAEAERAGTHQEAGLRGIIQSGENVVRCPMPGRISEMLVEPDQELEAGDPVCIIETMKMEQHILISRAGKIKKLRARQGKNVKAGAPLVELV